MMGNIFWIGLCGTCLQVAAQSCEVSELKAIKKGPWCLSVHVRNRGYFFFGCIVNHSKVCIHFISFFWTKSGLIL